MKSSQSVLIKKHLLASNNRETLVILCYTSESWIEVVCVSNKAPSSKGGEGSPSSSSTTDGFTDSGELSLK